MTRRRLAWIGLACLAVLVAAGALWSVFGPDTITLTSANPAVGSCSVTYSGSGGLGSGKTQWVKGLARGLNCAAPVHSPTFALVNEYAGGRLPLFHLDLYRLASREQVRSKR